jgi:hypothetical protein
MRGTSISIPVIAFVNGIKGKAAGKEKNENEAPQVLASRRTGTKDT